jgi:hypothetical protein
MWPLITGAGGVPPDRRARRSRAGGGQNRYGGAAASSVPVAVTGVMRDERGRLAALPAGLVV